VGWQVTFCWLFDGCVAVMIEFVGSEQIGLPEQIAELLKLLVDPGALAVGFLLTV
jgi:hypothetical protein